MEARTDQSPVHKECSLLCNAMGISHLYITISQLVIALVMLIVVKALLFLMRNLLQKEALVFMLVSFQGHWKHPVGYVLVDKVNAYDLNDL